jgi:2-methylcitrate dehydratase PrpD
VTGVQTCALPILIRSIKNIILNITGTTVAGSNREGCQTIVNLVRKWGGAKEATILVHGGAMPAHNAAFANAYMARALDIDDAMFPGMHVGASTVMTALAVAEQCGGCGGKDFITALAIGHEVASRFNSVTDYVGFDHTGVSTIMGAATTAGKILKLNEQQMVDTLGHAFNRSGGSFQSNVDGALAVRIIQGGAAQGGITSAELGKEGLIGPKNFYRRYHGYLHLFGRINTLSGI